MKSRRLFRSSDILALLFLASWRLLYYFPVTLDQRVFSEGDLLWLLLPIRTELTRALAAGHLPLWTPALQAGFPLFAEGEVAALYPINLIFHWLLPAPAALSYTILFNLGWAAIGMYMLCRTLGLHSASALFAGFVFGAAGFMTAQLSHSPHVAVASWLPWLLFFQQKYFQAWMERNHSVFWFLMMSFAVSLQLLGGFPQFAMFNIATFGLFALVTPLFFHQPPSQPKVSYWAALKCMLTVVLATMLGIGLAAVQLLPTVELVGLSIRNQEMSQAFFTSYSLELLALTQFILPFAYLGMPQASNMEYWAYLGVLPLLFVFLAPLLRCDARTWFFGVLGVVALLLALGGNTPLYEWLYYFPLLNRFRVPARFLLLFTFAAAFLAATGFEELQHYADSLHRRTNRLVAVLIIGLVVLVAGVLYLAYDQPIESWLEAWRWLPFLLFLASIAIIASIRSRWMTHAVFVTLAIGLTVFDLAAFTAVFRDTLNRTAVPTELLQAPRTVQAMDNRDLLYRVLRTKAPMTEAAIRAVLFRNISIFHNKQSLEGYLPSLAIQRNQQYIDAMALGMRNLIGIRYYLLPLEMPQSGTPLPPGWDEFEPDGGLTPAVLGAQHKIPPVRVVQIEITSYTDQTLALPDSGLVGEMVLGTEIGQTVTLPIRLGVETADWAYDSVAQVAHSKPQMQSSFPAYLTSIGRAFEGHKYIARYQVAQNSAPLVVNSVSARSFLPVGGLNIEQVLLLDDTGRATSLAALWYRNDLALAFRSHAAAMWENQDALPRAFVVHRAEIVNGDDVLERLKAPDFPYAQLVLLSDAPVSVLMDEMANDAHDQTTVIEYKPERVVVNVKTDSAGYLLLTDTWYPGWIVWVDSRETPIYRADYIFRAVPLSAGEHSVVFEYRPLSLVWGMVISGTSVLIGGAIVILAYRTRHRGSTAARAEES